MAFKGVSSPLLELYRSISSSYITLVDRPIDYTPYKSVYQFGAVWDGIPSSGALRMMDSAGKEFPHFKAVDFNHLEAENNTCFRGELLISLRMILGQLRKVCLVHHQIAPVILYSPFLLFHCIFGIANGVFYRFC